MRNCAKKFGCPRVEKLLPSASSVWSISNGHCSPKNWDIAKRETPIALPKSGQKTKRFFSSLVIAILITRKKTRKSAIQKNIPWCLPVLPQMARDEFSEKIADPIPQRRKSPPKTIMGREVFSVPSFFLGLKNRSIPPRAERIPVTSVKMKNLFTSKIW